MSQDLLAGSQLFLARRMRCCALLDGVPKWFLKKSGKAGVARPRDAPPAGPLPLVRLPEVGLGTAGDPGRLQQAEEQGAARTRGGADEVAGGHEDSQADRRRRNNRLKVLELC